MRASGEWARKALNAVKIPEIFYEQDSCVTNRYGND
jgi:hypothetical protein